MAEAGARAAAGWRGFARSTIGRFVGLAFLCQFLVTGGVLLFVQQAKTQLLDRLLKLQTYHKTLSTYLFDAFHLFELI